MLTTLAAAFTGTFAALLKVFLVILVAGLLVRRGVLTQTHVDGMSSATVVLFLPCLIFARVIESFDPGALGFWWVLPLSGIVMALAGLGMAALLFWRELPAKRNMLPLASMQNAGYLILPVGLALYPQEFNTFALYCFLFILGFNPVLWSVGKLLISDSRGSQNGWRGLFTPPLVANLAALAGVGCGLDQWIPAPVLSAVDLVGQAAVPVATVVLGAVLGTVRFRLRPYLADAVRVLGIKFVLLPVAVLGCLLLLAVGTREPLLARFYVLESAAAPAAGLVLLVRTYGGDEQKVGSIMLLSYTACTLTLPLWLAIWELLGP